MTTNNDIVIPQATSPGTLGSAVGDDTYLISGYVIGAGKNITLTDTQGSNSLQWIGGLSVSSSIVASSTLQLTLTNGAIITVLDADKFTYEVGGNLLQGVNQADISFATFATTHLGVTVPTSGLASGGTRTLGTAAAGALSYTAPNNSSDILVPQDTSPAALGSAVGDDTYVISASTLTEAKAITITDSQGANAIQFVPGLAITGFSVASTALQLSFSSGASVTILDADKFTYEINGNIVAGLNAADVSFASFVSSALEVSVPSSGVVTGGAKTIGSASAGSATVTIAAGSSSVIAATSGADVFGFSLAAAQASAPNTQVSINGFSTTADRLQLDLGSIATGLTKLSQLNGLALANGATIAVQSNPITQNTLATFGPDANGDIIAITLVGITDPTVVSL